MRTSAYCQRMVPLALLAVALTQAPVPPARAVDHADESESFELVFAFHGGGGPTADGGPSLFGGLKIGFGCCIEGKHPHERGRTITLDVGYDRVGHSTAVATELSVMIPVARFPRPHSRTSNYLRIYAEPGVGMRGGSGIEPYASGKVMLAFLSDQRIFKLQGSPFIEIQGRLTMLAPHRRDIRLLAGAIVGLCKHCGLD